MRPYLRPFALSVAILVSQCAFGAQANTSASATVSRGRSPGAAMVTIPGPLRSFMRMAGISQKAAPEDVLPLFAHNVFQRGYLQGTPTEWLKLVDGYVRQARSLQALAGPANLLQVQNCEASAPLLQVLGYRLTAPCGQKNITLATANPELAFLTSDSGFPLTDLEESLQNGTPFSYPYAASQVPVLLWEGEWTSLNSGQKVRSSNLLELLIESPSIARLYWALNKNDTETRTALQKSPGLGKLLPYAAVLDFYGSEISIHSGRIDVPGGAAAEPTWKELVGAPATSPGEFVLKLVSKDDGWLAAYFDVLSRLNYEQQSHFTQPARLVHFYQDLRLRETKPGAAKSVFPQAPQLLALDTLVAWEPNGDPHIPGDLATWKQILLDKTKTKSVKEWGHRFQTWDNPEQLLEAITAFSRTNSDSGPIQVYLLTCQIDSARAPDHPLSPATVSLLAKRFAQYKDWYLLFSEFPALDDESIARFIEQADAVDKISNETLRVNALGIFQANIGLWQILARQREISQDRLKQSWMKLLDPYSAISNEVQLLDAGRDSFQSLFAAVGRPAASQADIIDLLAGPRQNSPDGQRVQQFFADRIRAVLEDQKLVSLDTIFTLSDGLDVMAHGGPRDGNLAALASELQEFELPKPIFTNNEKLNWAPRNYVSHHEELQLKTDLTRIINTPAPRPQYGEARGRLTPFLRDTLVGLNYAYYEPPNSHVLHNNPLFIRAHDFAGISMIGFGSTWSMPELVGAGVAAGGGAYLMGSLADLPYALSETEQDFIAPENIQALVWKELVPNLMEDAITMRWWRVNQTELHAAALYQRSGEELVLQAQKDPALHKQMMSMLADRIDPQRLEHIDAALRSQSPSAAISYMLPADTFFLAAEFRQRSPEQAATLGPASKQLDDLLRSSPQDAGVERISRDFGIPHPTLAYTYTRELLNVKPFPFVGGYAVRFFGESWESSNLYWARLADDMGYSPVLLNRLVPDLTRRMAAKIFATELEDWPAILRAMQETGDEVRRSKAPTQTQVSTTHSPDDKTPVAKEQ